jgi:predicted MFS family arabinose efflux permease
VFAIFAAIYPDDYEKRIGINEAAVSIGIMIGPMLGAIIYNFGGFFYPFAVFGII